VELFRVLVLILIWICAGYSFLVLRSGIVEISFGIQFWYCTGRNCEMVTVFHINFLVKGIISVDRYDGSGIRDWYFVIKDCLCASDTK
jgi:hypothetical protein